MSDIKQISACYCIAVTYNQNTVITLYIKTKSSIKNIEEKIKTHIKSTFSSLFVPTYIAILPTNLSLKPNRDFLTQLTLNKLKEKKLQ